MNTDSLATIEETPKARISAIWILPIIAAMIGGWLIYKAIIEAPIEIEVYFGSGEGLEEGKTGVRFEGIKIGKVKSIKAGPELIGVVAILEMDRRTKMALVKNTQFWVVRPEVSLSGITGLSTVLSGNYITLRIGDGPPSRVFKALASAPPKALSVPGLHLTLKSDDLGSVSKGSPILYKKFTIGDVQSYQLEKDGHGVSIGVFIKPEFTYLVRENSRFWNASGITLKGGLTGFDVRTESLTAILKGGIVLTELDESSSELPAKNGDVYALFDDYLAALARVEIKVEFPVSKGLKPDITKVLYKGVPVGQVEEVLVNEDLSAMVAHISLLPRVADHLNANTRIWESKPTISLKDLSGISSLISGASIQIDFDGGEADSVRDFVALTAPPIFKKEAPGLHIILTVEALRSVNRGTEISFRNVVVGSVVDYQLAKDSQSILVNAHIEPEYIHLVNSSSRFWNASGVEIKGGLSGLKIRTESINSILVGGLAFHTPDINAAQVKNGSSFRLYGDFDSAHLSGLPITLSFDDGDGLKKGTSIKYEGIEVGKVISVALDKELDGVVVKAVLNESARDIARENTRFWVVKPELGLVKTANISTLLTGQYITFRIGDGEPRYDFQGSTSPPLAKKEKLGLNIIVTSPRLGSLKEGVSVFYREIAVGSVTGYRLADNADHVRIYVNIEENFAPLVREHSRFWNASGLDIGFKLFGGAKIKTESLESILAGGISFATPNNDQMGEAVAEGATFSLSDSRNDSWLNWQPKIPLTE